MGYTIIFVNTPNPGHKILIVIKEQKREAKTFLFPCCTRKRLTRCFIERIWGCKNLWTNPRIIETGQFIKQLEEFDKLAGWYEI